MTTYTVKWREPDGQTFIGRLALGAQSLRLEGRQRGADALAVRRQFPYEEVVGLHSGSRRVGRLDGRPAFIVERAEGSYLVAGLGAPIVHELLERLAKLVAPHIPR